MGATLSSLKVRASRHVSSGAPVFAGAAKTEPLHVTVAVRGAPGPRQKIELWSAEGPGSPGAKRLAGSLIVLSSARPPALVDGKAFFTLPLGAPLPPARITAVHGDGRLGATFPVLNARQFAEHITARVQRANPTLTAVAEGRLEGEGRVLRVTMEEHSSLVRDVMRVPVDVVHIPSTMMSTHNVLRAMGRSASGLAPPPGSSPVQVWETRVVGNETLTVPRLTASYRETLPHPSGSQLIRVWRNPVPGHAAPDSVAVDPAFRLSVAARDPRAARRLLTADLQRAMDALLAMLGTQRVVIDGKGLHTTLSTGVFTEETVSDWLEQVLEVSRVLRRAL